MTSTPSAMSRRNLLLGGASLLGLAACSQDETKPKQLESVRFGCLPYGDHTQAIIGVERKLFEKAGIDLKYDTIRVEQAVPLLQSRRYDVVSVAPGLLLAGFNDAPDLQMFVYGSLFQGYAVMAQPNTSAKTYDEILKSEPDQTKAALLTIGQLRGQRFAYPPEGGIKPFLDLLFKSGNLTRSDVKSIVVDDPISVAAMQRGDADFQVGGAPSRITLQKAGFKPIISAIDLARAAAPSPDSEPLRAVFPDGWAAHKDFIAEKPALIQRLAKVCFQINALMRTDRDAVATLHMRYLSQVTGQPFTLDDAKIIYDQLDPFLTFEQQRPWFEDNNYPLNHRHVLGAQIKSFVQDGLYSGKRIPTVADITVAEQVFKTISDQGGVEAGSAK